MFTFFLTELFCRREKIKKFNQNSLLKAAAVNFFKNVNNNLDEGAALTFTGFSLAQCSDLTEVASAKEAAKSDLRKRFNFVADVVEKVGNAVVSIEVKSESFFSLKPPKGSGFIVGDDGLILTNAHVVSHRKNSRAIIKLQDGRSFLGNVEDVDVKWDLATVRIKARDLPVIKLGSSSDVRPGEWVIAIGNPLSLSNSVTSGLVSCIRRRSTEIGIGNQEMEYLQTDASITFGNSGGPLLNLDGEAIGINCMKITGGISFAIPIDYAKGFLKSAEEKRTQQPNGTKLKSTGATVIFLTSDGLEKMKFGKSWMTEEITRGLLVKKVILGSPAYLSGLKAGDVVTHVNSLAIEDINAVNRALEIKKPLSMTVLRNGSYKEIFITPESI